MSDNSIFERAKKYDIVEFVEGVTGIPQHNNKNTECPFCGRKEKFSLQRTKQMFKCFHTSCDKGWGGDIITFAERYFEVKKVEAAKKILEFFGESIDDGSQRMSREEARARAEEQRKLREIEAKKRAREEAELKAKRVEEMTKRKDALIQEANKHIPDIQKIFPQYRGYLGASFLDKFIGWDSYHESLCIITMDREMKKVYNIKHRGRKIKDENGNKVNADGKWLSARDCTTFPFPLPAFDDEADYCFLVEGEKDALNLACLNVNVLTLGGVTNSWDKYKEILRGKKIYIFYDNDPAGYEGAMQRAYELKEVSGEIYIVLFFDLIGSKCKKGYDVSDYLRDKKWIFYDSPAEIITEETINIAKGQFFESIKYATYKANAATFKRISNHLDLSEGKKERYGITRKTKEDLYEIWSAFSVKPKAELDDVEKQIEDLSSLLKSKSGQLIASFDNLMGDGTGKALLDAIKIKKDLLATYSKMHRVDLEEAFYLMLKNSKHPIFRDIDGFKAWDGKYFIPISEEDIKFFCRNYWFESAKVQKKSWHDQTSSFLIKDLSNHIFNIDEKRRELPYRAYALENGTYMIWDDGKTRFVDNFDYKRFPIVSLDFSYSADASCPKWHKFLDRVLPNQDDQNTLQEFFGYCLMPSHHYEKFLFLYGRGGANGKSVIQSVLSRFFSGRTSQIDLQNLNGHNLHGLKDKMLNTGTEIDASGAIEGLQALKALTSSTDTIMINPKNRDTYTLDKKSQPKMVFSGNKKPNSGLDEGVFRRMLMLEFTSSINDSEKVFAIDERFIDEMDGIFNWAILGLDRLVRNRGFTMSAGMKETLDDYRKEQNPMRVYVEEGCEFNSGFSYDKASLYKHYSRWAKERGYQPMAINRFHSHFKAECKDQNKDVSEYRKKGEKRQYLGVMPVIEEVED